MPKTRFESIIFTAVTAWIMVYIMTLYNTILSGNSFTNRTFLTALKGMWIEYVIIFFVPILFRDMWQSILPSGWYNPETGRL